MKIEEREIVQTPITEKIYIASDDKEFKNEKSCLKYETLLTLGYAISHIPKKRVDIVDSLTVGDAYYITCEEDFKLVSEYYCKAYSYGYDCSGNWNYDNQNWYIFYSEDGGDNCKDTLYCYNLDYYKNLFRSFFSQFDC